MKVRYLTPVVAIVVLAFGAASCSSAPGSACDVVGVENAWVRLPPADTTALYMDITNKGDASFALTSASSDFASTYELHESKMADGKMVMEKVPGQEIAVAPGSTVKLEPGGLHVMAIGVEQPLTVGEEKTFTLGFTNGCTMEISAPVRTAEDAAGGGGG